MCGRTNKRHSLVLNRNCRLLNINRMRCAALNHECCLAKANCLPSCSSPRASRRRTSASRSTWWWRAPWRRPIATCAAATSALLYVCRFEVGLVAMAIEDAGATRSLRSDRRQHTAGKTLCSQLAMVNICMLLFLLNSSFKTGWKDNNREMCHFPVFKMLRWKLRSLQQKYTFWVVYL